MTDYLISVNNDEIPVTTPELATLNSIKISNTDYHSLFENRSYDIRLLHADYLNKKLSISINGNKYDIEIEDQNDQQVKKMGLLALTSQKVNCIKAPMPGLILDVMVEKGQEISEGTPLLVLSAMKMENIILSQGEGVVKSIEVIKDDTVEKGQLIIEME